MLSEYRKALQRGIVLSGPTSFAPVIRKAIDLVKASGNELHVLLIIADGQVSEALDCKRETINAIVEASHVPLSIVVVGVGDGPFDQMETFDDQLPERRFDNLQFVDFQPFQAALAAAPTKEKQAAIAALDRDAAAEFAALEEEAKLSEDDVAKIRMKMQNASQAVHEATSRVNEMVRGGRTSERALVVLLIRRS